MREAIREGGSQSDNVIPANARILFVQLRSACSPVLNMLAAASSAVPSILAYTEEEWASRERNGSLFQRAVEHDAVQML